MLTFHIVQGIDALMNAIESWNGGVIVISHDERFINTVAKEVSAVQSICFVLRSSAIPALGVRRGRGLQVQGRRIIVQGMALLFDIGVTDPDCRV